MVSAVSRFHVVVAVSLLSTAAIAADTSYERILIPITSADTAGAHGALWTTELWVRNDSDQPVSVFPLTFSDATTPEHVTLPLAVARPSPDLPPGQFIYVTRTLADSVRFNVRVFDANRVPAVWGTEIPVIREKGFLRDRVVLFNVPTSSDLRISLRVYGATDGDANVRLRIFDMRGSEPLLDAPLHLASRAPVQYNPAYAQVLSLSDTFPQIRASAQVRVEITSEQSGVDLWAFVTVVSNTTNAITTITPQ